ncbi:MAG: hypothetical protein RQ833_05555 [Sphingomonadaceae bacterium]|nr:hypothetical protein [Sphingomonadaceae bacterium]
MRPALVALAGLWFVQRPYHGVYHDARIYMGRALADLDPARFGADPMYALDGQTGFSAFRIVARDAVAALGLGPGALALALVGLACWFAAAWALTGALTRGRARLALMLGAMLIPPVYGGGDIFRFGETFASPRPYAEAAAMMAVAAALRGRMMAGSGWGVLACLIHPLMGLPGLALALSLRVIRHGHWLRAGVAVGAAVALVLAAAWAGVPVVDRLFERFDPTWAHTHRFYLLIGHWPVRSFAITACQLGTLAIAAARLRGRLMRFSGALLALSVLGLLATWAGSDISASVLVTQLQPWRVLWLAALGSGLMLARLALAASTLRDRAIVAALAAGWLFCDGPWIVGGALATAGALAAGLRLPRRLMTAAPIPVALVALYVVGLWVYAGAAFAWVRWPFGELHSEQLRPLLFAAALLAVLAQLARGRRVPEVRAPAGLAGALAAAALLLWDDRSDFQLQLERGGFPELEAVLDQLPGPVFFAENTPELSWRAVWWSGLQAAPALFSRPLAVVWDDRLNRLTAAGLETLKQRRNYEVAPESERDFMPTPEKLDRLCHSPDSPAWVVAGAEPLSPATRARAKAIVTLPYPFPVLSTVRWKRLSRRQVAVFACRAPGPAAAAAGR